MNDDSSADACNLAQVQEVWDTFVVLARLGSPCVEAYVISMASSASDVLAVELLKREACRKVGSCYECMLCQLSEDTTRI